MSINIWVAVFALYVEKIRMKLIGKYKQSIEGYIKKNTAYFIKPLTFGGQFNV
jgi:hypothetical protein